MACVVGSSGKITGCEVSRSLNAEFGLDQAALAAAAQWEFKPGRKAGKPVAVRITIEMTFMLKTTPFLLLLWEKWASASSVPFPPR